jgi:hypothetical protein
MGHKKLVFTLEFLGSVLYLWAVFAGVENFIPFIETWGAGNILLPLIYAGAVVSTIALFISSFSNMWPAGEPLAHTRAKVSMIATTVAAFALFALTEGTVGFYIVLIAFVISFMASGFAYLI